MLNRLLANERRAVEAARRKEHEGRNKVRRTLASLREEGERNLVKPATLVGLFAFGFLSERSFGAVARARTETLLAGIGYTALIEVGSEWLATLKGDATLDDNQPEDGTKDNTHSHNAHTTP